MVVFPNCKINLGLNILRKRKDGYHDLETVFYPIPLNDALEVVREQLTADRLPLTDDLSEGIIANTQSTLHNERSTVNRSPITDDLNEGIIANTQSTLHDQRSTVNGVRLTVSGLDINGDANNNLCVKAYHLLKKDFPSLPAIQMHLHKVIPMGAGLGGGSADGAFALKLLNDTFHLNLSSEQLIAYALQLGSDCPFFILNKPCFATGRGEVMETIQLDLSAYQFVIVNPKIHIGTGWAFGNITPNIPEKSIKDIIHQPIDTWKDSLINDFEQPAINHYPEIGNIKTELYNLGAIYSSMTGSGSTVFGIFEKGKEIKLSFPKHYFVHTSNVNR